MFESFPGVLDQIENFIWGYFAAPIILLLGLYFTFKSNFFQFRKFPAVVRTFIEFLKLHENKQRGVHPLKVFFASVGGCVGIGNIVSICTAIQIGGPGALFWIWITAIVGGMLKYAEVFLGLRYRIANDQGGYNGGPMYYLQKAFKTKWAANASALLLCVYGIEVYQFNVIIDSLSTNTHINPHVIAVLLLALVILACSGGVRRVGAISSAIIPTFMVLFVSMGTWVLFQNIEKVPHILYEVFVGAFTGHAAIGGFVGSIFLLTMSQGIKRGAYSSDVGIGYASVIYSESSVKNLPQQASLVLFDVFLDTFVICTTSLGLILLTDVWHEPVNASLLVQNALSQYFPYMHFFMPLFLFLLGYSTINAFISVGLKCADFLLPVVGRKLYYGYAVVMFLIFSFVDTLQAQAVMTIAGGLLLIVNCWGIYRLRHEVTY